jgi:predicted RNA-binding Zn ribbon-like protein
LDFVWVGNHPGLDLCNTELVLDGEPVDLLRRPEDLQDWLTAVGAPARATATRPAPSTLRWAVRLRDALRAALDPTVDAPAPLAALNAVLASVRGAPAVTEDGRVELVARRAEDQRRLDLAALVLPALALDRHRIRRCADPACVLLFHDTSKGGQRRWHDMATCGNRAKAAAHYARTARARRR